MIRSLCFISLSSDFYLVNLCSCVKSRLQYIKRKDGKSEILKVLCVTYCWRSTSRYESIWSRLITATHIGLQRLHYHCQLILGSHRANTPCTMRQLYPVLLVISLSNPASCLNYQPPICSLEGLRIGAGLGSVAGAVGGVAATSGATTLATCPALMVSTLGHGLVRNQLSRNML